MSDRYAQLVNAPLASQLARRVGLPQPVALERHRPGDPPITGCVLLGAAPGGRLARPVAEVLAGARAQVATSLAEPVRSAVAGVGVDAAVFNPDAPGERRFKALVLDATGIADSTELIELQRFFHPTVRRIERCGRVIVLGTPPADCPNVRAATAQRALEGFTRSLGKEIGRGATVQLVYVSPGADRPGADHPERRLASTLRFLLSPRSAYVSGQVIHVGAYAAAGGQGADGAVLVAGEGLDWERPLAGRVALVTGAARGIGEAIARVLARDGARVIGLDVPALGGDLRRVIDSLGDGLGGMGDRGVGGRGSAGGEHSVGGQGSGGGQGSVGGQGGGGGQGSVEGQRGEAIELDITAADAPARIAERCAEGLDVVVHNAGVTRDRTLAKMPAERWSELMEINLSSQERIDDALLEGVLREGGGRIVCVSSMSGIAGNAGQTNYATSKAGVIGMVQALAPELAPRGITINAVAPGFIETAMTSRMPITIREAGRRMSSLSQGGLPIDVAETIAWLASPASGAITGNVIRVCGQNLLGA